MKKKVHIAREKKKGQGTNRVEIMGIVMILLGFFVCLSLGGYGMGIMGNLLRNGFYVLFGVASFGAALVLIFTGVIYVLTGHAPNMTRRLVFSLIAVWILLAGYHHHMLPAGSNFSVASFMTYGGMFCGIPVGIIRFLAGNIGTTIILTGLFVIDILLLTHWSVSNGAKKVGEQTEKRIGHVKARIREKQEAYHSARNAAENAGEQYNLTDFIFHKPTIKNIKKDDTEDLPVNVFSPADEKGKPVCGEATDPTVSENALIESYRKKDFMGKVYLSPEFKNYLVPFSQRSASKSLKTIVRGSRLHIAEDIKTLRAFIWWTNTNNGNDIWDEYRVDIDLSAAIFDENWNYMEHISYTNLRSRKYQACHSGDITNGGSVNGDGVSEFLDVDIDSVVKYGARYVVYQVYSFTNQTFKDLPHAMFGWMGRESAGSGEIYEPKTVEQKMDLTANSTIAIPVIFDCVNREIIWCDMNQTLDSVRCNHFGNNLESNLSGVAATCYGVVNIRKPNLYDLISLHIKARGIPVDTKEEADVIFDVNDGITPFDTEIFMGEYL